MDKVIDLDGQKIEYESRTNKRARGIRLAIYPGGRIKVTTRPRIPDFLVRQFLRSKAAWILAKQAKQKLVPVRTSNRAEYMQHKSAALKLVKARLEHFNKHYNFKYNKVSIKNHKSLWGSCSKRGNLNFNYKLALIPPEQADYVIVHELCHLSEFNHSARFWTLVSQTIPNHLQLRKSIKGLQ
jgi:predicted metal-dependent hydrolase